MHLPAEVKVGPFRFAVLGGLDAADFFKGTDNGDCGDCDAEGLLIRVSGEIAPDLQRETLLHEVLHAATFTSGLTQDLTDKAEENVVRKLATVLFGVLRENPLLVEYLTA